MTLLIAGGEVKFWTTVANAQWWEARVTKRGDAPEKAVPAKKGGKVLKVEDFPIDITKLKFDDTLKTDEFEAFTSPEDIIALQKFLWLKSTNPTVWPRTKDAIIEYKQEKWIIWPDVDVTTVKKGSPEHNALAKIDERTYQSLAHDMLRAQLEAGGEYVWKDYVSKAALSILLGRSLWLRLDGKYGPNIESMLATIVWWQKDGVLLKATIGYLTQGNKYTFGAADRELHGKIMQYVGAFQASYGGFSRESFIKEIWAGVVFFDVQGTIEGKKTIPLAEVMEWGQSTGTVVWAITWGRRTEWFLKGLFEFSPKLRAEIFTWYFTATQTSPLSDTRNRVSWALAGVKAYYRFSSDVEMSGFVEGDTTTRYRLGGGLKITLPGWILATPSIERSGTLTTIPEYKGMLTFTIPLWGAWADPAPGIYKETPQWWVEPVDADKVPQNLSWVGVLHRKQQPKPWLTFADLAPVRGSDTTRIVVWGKLDTKIIKHPVVDRPSTIGLPTVISNNGVSITVRPGDVMDPDGTGPAKGVVLYRVDGTEIARLEGNPVTFTGLTSGTPYDMATYGQVVVAGTPGLTTKVWERVRFTPLSPDTPASLVAWTTISVTSNAATVTSGTMSDPDGVRDVFVVLMDTDNTERQRIQMPLNQTWTVSVAQQLTLSWLTPGKNYKVRLIWKVKVMPAGTWKDEEISFTVTTPNLTDSPTTSMGWNVISVTATTASINSGTISDPDWVQDVFVVLMHPNGSEMQRVSIPVNTDGKSSLARQLNLTWLTPGESYRVRLIWEARVSPTGAWKKEEGVFTFTTPNIPDSPATFVTWNAISITPTTAIIDSGSIIDADGVRDVSVTVFNNDGSINKSFWVSISNDGKSSIAQQLNLGGLTPGSTYTVKLKWQVKVMPTGTWKDEEITFTFMTPNMPDTPAVLETWSAFGITSDSATINSGTISDIDGVQNVLVTVFNPDTSINKTFTVAVSGDGRSSIPQQLNLGGLTPVSIYRVELTWQVRLSPTGGWREEKVSFTFGTTASIPPQPPILPTVPPDTTLPNNPAPVAPVAPIPVMPGPGPLPGPAPVAPVAPPINTPPIGIPAQPAPTLIIIPPVANPIDPK
jgi:phage tail tube protein FII